MHDVCVYFLVVYICWWVVNT